MELWTRRYWIFDMDGTLTVPMHNFDAIRRTLGIPDGRPILETLDRLPPAERTERRQQLDAIELELAARAQPQPAARRLLERLHSLGRIGILTRNSRENALRTLEACGFEAFFDPDHILGRDESPPKPHPGGVEELLRRWNGRADQAVVVGDYLWDLMSGRTAGTSTIYLDPSGRFPYEAHADWCVASLADVLERLEAGDPAVDR